MSRPHQTDAAPEPVPCAASPGGAGRYLHPEGVCACFRGGPAPILVLAPEVALLAGRPGVFDTTAVGQPTRRRRPLGERVRRWFRRHSPDSGL
jgi:hypothetical protein